VSEVGETVTELPVTVPMLLSMLKETVFDTDHDKVLVWPMAMEEGEAEKEDMMGLGALTSIMIKAVTLPLLLVAVNV
jgi:hypothetical protein